jgi:hypothetical protein
MAHLRTATRHRGNGHFAENLKETKEAFTEAALKAKETAGSLSEKILHDFQIQTKDLRNKTIEYVRKKPLTALGGAILAGMILSWWLRK